MNAGEYARYDEIERLAYAIWRAKGQPEGCALDYWLKVEAETNAPDGAPHIPASSRQMKRPTKKNSVSC